MSSSSVEQLKEKLLCFLNEERNVTNMDGALEVITHLQTAPITKEVLEATRLGLLVNDIRRKNQEANPQLAKLCRGLIKEWQKLVSDSSTAAVGDGKLGVSPVPDRLSTPTGRSATPRQVMAAKLANSDLQCSPSPTSTLSVRPSTPAMMNGIDGAQSAANNNATSQPDDDLKMNVKCGGPSQTDEIRKVEPAGAGDQPANSNKGAEEAANRRKRKASADHSSRTTLGLVNGGSKPVSPCAPLASTSPSAVENAGSRPGAVQSAESTNQVAQVSKPVKKNKASSPAPTGPTPATNTLQRPKLKSTADLVAEMTSSYPESMSVNLKNVMSAPASPQFGSSSKTVMQSVLAAQAEEAEGEDDDSKDEDYEEHGNSKPKAKVMWAVVNGMTSGAVNKSELIDRYLRDHSTGNGGSKDRGSLDSDNAETPSDTKGQIYADRPPVDWYATVQLPPLDLSVLETEMEEDAGRSDQSKQAGMEKTERGECEEENGRLLDSCIPDQDGPVNGDRWRSRLLKTTAKGDRQVLAMPYVDVGLPDFLEFCYPDQQHYLAHWSDL